MTTPRACFDELFTFRFLCQIYSARGLLRANFDFYRLNEMYGQTTTTTTGYEDGLSQTMTPIL